MPVDYAGIMRITVGDTNYDAACGYEDTGLYDSGIDRRLGKELCGTDMAGVRKLLCTAGGGRARKPVPYIGRNKPDTAKSRRRGSRSGEYTWPCSSCMRRTLASGEP